MNVRAGVTVVIVAVLLAGTGPIATAAGATQSGQSQSEPFALQQDGIDADEVRMDVAVRPNGTAEWTLEFWVRLDDNESETAFESLRADIRDDPENHTQSFADRMNDTVGAASNATGREMAADGFSVSTDRQSFAREYGVVRYTFDWHGFAASDGDELRAGDALEGLYLDDGTRLLIEWPAGYELTSATPTPDDEREQAVIWRGGDTDFVSGEPRVVVTADTGPNAALLAAAAVAVAGFGAAGAWWYRNRRSAADQAAGGDGESPRPSDASDSVAATAAATTAEAADSSAAGAADAELLTNEEQVLRLVRERGGRMKQQAVVDELEWTDAKTSKVVSGLREDGELESFRLGRENVLSLPDEDGEETDGADGEDGGAS